MGEKLFNSLISALFGGLAGIGAVWYLSDGNQTGPYSPSASAVLPQDAVFETLEVKRLKVTEGIRVHDTVSGEPLIEMADGSITAKKKVLTDYLGGYRLVGQRLQITTGDPSLTNNAVCSELATNEDGGAYFALLSPKGTHSVNIGFDKQETGFIISQNNVDSAMVAQAILPLPTRNQPSDGGMLPTAPGLASSVPPMTASVPDSAPAGQVPLTNTPITDSAAPGQPAPVLLPESSKSAVPPFPAEVNSGSPAGTAQTAPGLSMTTPPAASPGFSSYVNPAAQNPAVSNQAAQNSAAPNPPVPPQAALPSGGGTF